MLERTSIEEGARYIFYTEAARNPINEQEKNSSIENALVIFESKVIPCDNKHLLKSSNTAIVTLKNLYEGMLYIRRSIKQQSSPNK
jgi:hypothetical protein